MIQKLLSTIKDENMSYGEILSRFENKKLDLRTIINWRVTSKPYSIYNENEKHTLIVNYIFATNYSECHH